MADDNDDGLLDEDGMPVLGTLDLTAEDYGFDSVEDHIEENLQDEVVREALAKGLDLRVYSKQVEAELAKVEKEAIEDYLAQAGHMTQLHMELQSCDDILLTMEKLLGTFQEDLGTISTQIETLQEQSQKMNVKLANRKKALQPLSSFVDGLAISAELVDAIYAATPVGNEFFEALGTLDTKLAFIGGLDDDVACAAEASNDLHKLLAKASAKLREFYLTKIASVRKPLSNPQLPQNSMLKYSDGYRFLLKNDKPVATELRDEYVDTFSKMHLSYFKAYHARLAKLRMDEVADKDDLLGIDDTARRTAFFSPRPATRNKASVFTLGARNALLAELDSPIIVPLTAKEGVVEAKLPYEKLFRSLHYALFDNAAREYLFGVGFFGVRDSQAVDFCKAVMGKTTMLLLKEEDEHVKTSYDSLGLLLCARVITHYQAQLRQKQIPCLEHYFQQMLALIMPRVLQIIMAHADSVRLTDPHKLPNLDTRPHYIVRRYAEYSGALLQLNDGQEFEAVTHGLVQLRQEAENFILRVAAEFGSRKEQLIFLINNYDLMLSVYGERTAPALVRERDEFAQLLELRVKEFGDETLAAPFGGMIAFVKDVEAQFARCERDKIDTGTIPYDERRVLALIRTFAKDWKKAVDDIDSEVMRSFANFKNGTAVLQHALSQLVSFYERFLEILKQKPFKKPGGYEDLVDRHQVFNAAKKMHKAMAF